MVSCCRGVVIRKRAQHVSGVGRCVEMECEIEGRYREGHHIRVSIGDDLEDLDLLSVGGILAEFHGRRLPDLNQVLLGVLRFRGQAVFRAERCERSLNRWLVGDLGDHIARGGIAYHSAAELIPFDVLELIGGFHGVFDKVGE